MISFADLFGFPPPVEPSQSTAPTDIPTAPQWPNPPRSFSPPFSSGVSGAALRPGSVAPPRPFTGVDNASWSPQAGTLDPPLSSPLPPPRLPGGGILGALPAAWANGSGGDTPGGFLDTYAGWHPGPFANLSAPGSFVGASFGPPLSSSVPATYIPLPPPQASWAAPHLPLWRSDINGDTLNARQVAYDSANLSDADPDAWIPNAQYANRNTRRGGRQASEPELSPRKKSAGPSTTITRMSLADWSRTIACYSRSTTDGGCHLNATFRGSKTKSHGRGANRAPGPWRDNTICHASLRINLMPAASISRIT